MGSYPFASSNTNSSPDRFETTQPPPYMPKGISSSMKKILKGAKLKPSSYESIHKILLEREEERENESKKIKRNCNSPDRRMTEMKRLEVDVGSVEM